MGNYVAKLNFGNANASLAKPAVVSEILRGLLSNQTLWSLVEPYALPPGVCGNRAFDQANIVNVVKVFDLEHGARLAAVEMSACMLWKYIYRELQKVFTCSGGRVLGLLEDKAEGNESLEADVSGEAEIS